MTWCEIPEQQHELCVEISDAIEEAIGADYLDAWTAYGITMMVLEYLTTDEIKIENYE